MRSTPLYVFARALAAWVTYPFAPYTVKGRDLFPEEGRVVVCCNHMANSDPVRLSCSQRRQIYYMAKAELFQFKPFGFILKKLGAFPVQRGKGDVEAIDTAAELLRDDCAVGVFIEGTRSKNGEFGKPKAGAVMLAYNNHAPILPVCIPPIGSKRPRLFHRAVVSFGELIPVEELGIHEGSGVEFRNASRLVMDKIRALRERDLRELEEKDASNHI